MTEPLVLLPGMNCSARLWDGVLPQLRPRTTVLVEQLDVPELGAQVDALLERLPERFRVAGLSLGGIVAMALCRLAPERVSALCLMATNARPPTDEQRATWTRQVAAVEAGTTARSIQEVLLPVLLGPHPPAATVDAVLAMGAETGEDRLVAQLRLQTTRVDERPCLAGVRVPTLVIAGAEDALCPPDRLREINDLVDGSELVELPATAHLVTIEQPDLVAAAMGRWLDRTS